MKNYLSIGEVSKIKGVSIKSLRYYEKIGIFLPIYVNETSRYRYYSTEQLVVLDLIVVCLDLGIPLKNFKRYLMKDGSVNIGELLEEGEGIIHQRIKKLNANLSFLMMMSSHLKRTNKIKKTRKEFIQTIPKRYYLTADWGNDLEDYRDISGRYSKLFRQCNELGIRDTFNQGILVIRKEDKTLSKVFLEIPHKVKQVDNLLILEKGDFYCSVIEESQLTQSILKGNQRVLIIKELFDLKTKPDRGLIEIQKSKEI